jgi:hypothetical protein
MCQPDLKLHGRAVENGIRIAEKRSFFIKIPKTARYLAICLLKSRSKFDIVELFSSIRRELKPESRIFAQETEQLIR